MPGAMTRIAGATLLYAAMHSLLASRLAKRAAARWLGERTVDTGYRAFFNAQSIVTLGALAAYCVRQPDRVLYEADGPMRLALRAGQAAGVATMTWGLVHVGPLRWAGLDSLHSAGPVAPTPEGQGPSLGTDGEVLDTGPFACSRHALNAAALPILWLQPRMTANLLAFNLIATTYLVVGSLHEELRQRRAYGEAYDRYRARGVPFFVPRRVQRLEPATREGIAIWR